MLHRSPRRRHLLARAGILTALLAGSAAHAVGTDAGRAVVNGAEATFAIGGVPQPPVVSNVDQTYVDELIDAAVVSEDAGPVGVSPGQANAYLQFSVTNTGNGTEAFRLIADVGVGGDDFDPTLNQIYLESNGVPGLQPAADTPYLAGSNDPSLAEDAVQIVYVDAGIGAFPEGAEGALTLRAVSLTLIANTGTDDPANPAFPVPGTAFDGAGDPYESGGGNVDAVVGTSHALATLSIRAEGRYRVSTAVVAITKTAIAVVDPFGGATLVPGAVITYRIDVAVSGVGAAEGLVITDPLPAELEYQPGSLTVTALPAGEEADDDFAPSGTDDTGFDAGTQTVRVSLGDVAGGTPLISIGFDAAIR